MTSRYNYVLVKTRNDSRSNQEAVHEGSLLTEGTCWCGMIIYTTAIPIHRHFVTQGTITRTISKNGNITARSTQSTINGYIVSMRITERRLDKYT